MSESRTITIPSSQLKCNPESSLKANFPTIDLQMHILLSERTISKILTHLKINNYNNSLNSNNSTPALQTKLLGKSTCHLIINLTTLGLF